MHSRILPLVAALAALAFAPAAHGADVYPLGDSITYGATYSAASTPGGYRGYLDALLTADGVDHHFVGSRTDNASPLFTASGNAGHDGWPGFRIEQDADNLDAGGRWLTGAGTRPPIFPDVAIVHLGTNDIGQRFDPGTTYPTGDGRVNYADAAQRALFVQHMTSRLDALVDKLQALRPNVRIVLSNVVPIASSNGTGAAHPATAEYATAVRDLAAAERAAGEKVVFADVFSAAMTNGTVTPGLISPDNVHPMPDGYRVMAQVYRDAVNAALAF